MSVKFAVAACLSVAFDINASELRESARGLQVDIEEIDGAVAVNGLPMSVARATGADVPLLADRLVDRWRIESGAGSVRVVQCCGWTVASRLQGRASQVIQWRGSADGELLTSTVDLGAGSGAVPTPTVPRIADCAWSTPVHGQVGQRVFLQVTARCNLEPVRALDLTARRLAGAGWRLQRSGPLVLQAQLGSLQAQLTAGPASDGPLTRTGGNSSLVLIESRPAPGYSR